MGSMIEDGMGPKMYRVSSKIDLCGRLLIDVMRVCES